MGPVLLLIDLQQDYLQRETLVPDAETLTHAVAALLQAWRQRGLPVIHVRTHNLPDGSNAMPHRQQARPVSCVIGSPGAQPPPSLAADTGEPVLAKRFFSAFDAPELLPRLQALGADTLVMAGAYTHACIQASVLDAYQRGFRVWLPAQALASDAPAHAELSLAWLASRAAERLETSVLLERLPPPSAPRPSAAQQAERFPVSWSGGDWQAAPDAPCWLHHSPSDASHLLARVPLGRAADVDRVAQAARAAQPAWARLSAPERAALLTAWAQLLEHKCEPLAALLAAEVGKPWRDGLAEVGYGLGLLRAAVARLQDAADQALAPDLRVRYRPLGCVGLVTPWNNPLAIPLGKIAPALVYGNTVVWKPAPQAPRLAALLLETAQQAGLPADVLTLVHGDADTARCLVDHPALAALSFTGSSAAGRELAVRCAARRLPLQAELGGNNAVLIGRSADVARLAPELAAAVYSFAGQRCTAPRRLIVDSHLLPDFAEAFVAAARALRLGLPADAATELGPLISQARAQALADQVAQARQAGAQVLLGGTVPADFPGGGWLSPTLLSGLDPQAELVRSEAFGPVAVLLPAPDFDAALQLCNGVDYGLLASLYSHDPSEQARFLDQAQAGILRINQPQGRFDADAPFGGWKQSGWGPPEHGRWDQDFYTRPQAVYGE